MGLPINQITSTNSWSFEKPCWPQEFVVASCHQITKCNRCTLLVPWFFLHKISRPEEPEMWVSWLAQECFKAQTETGQHGRESWVHSGSIGQCIGCPKNQHSEPNNSFLVLSVRRLRGSPSNGSLSNLLNSEGKSTKGCCSKSGLFTKCFTSIRQSLELRLYFSFLACYS